MTSINVHVKGRIAGGYLVDLLGAEVSHGNHVFTDKGDGQGAPVSDLVSGTKYRLKASFRDFSTTKQVIGPSGTQDLTMIIDMSDRKSVV